jgi:uncharacterized protein YjbI with pentapeptide repeats
MLIKFSDGTEREVAPLAPNANLRGANLYGANMSGANLRGADLSGADPGFMSVACFCDETCACKCHGRPIAKVQS